MLCGRDGPIPLCTSCALFLGCRLCTLPKLRRGSATIMLRFTILYSDLSQDSREARRGAVRDYLAAANLPTLTEDQSSDLERPFIVAELGAMVGSLPNRKSPGPDGFTKIYYKTFFSHLAVPMCNYFNSLARGGSIPLRPSWPILLCFRRMARTPPSLRATAQSLFLI